MLENPAKDKYIASALELMEVYGWDSLPDIDPTAIATEAYRVSIGSLDRRNASGAALRIANDLDPDA